MKQTMLLKVKQNQCLSPKLQQAIKLLHVSTQELELEIQQALESNPLLELGEDFADHEYTTHTQSPDQFHSLYEPPSLHDYLNWQLVLSPFTSRDRIIATTLIDSISDEGYLTVSLQEILSVLEDQYTSLTPQFDIDEVEMVLHRIQQFEPAGVAARNLQECMLLQIRAQELESLPLQICTNIINDHLELVAKKDYTKIKKNLGIDDLQLMHCIHILTNINPKPGLIYSAEKVEYILPDVTVTNVDGTWQTNLTQHVAHNLKISTSYTQVLQISDSKHDTASLRQQYNEAKWFIESIKQRNNTLLNVTNCIMQQQHEFLAHGETKLKPLVLQDIADALNISESTVSRISTKKYVHTPKGTFELKFFFSSSVHGESGALCSSTAIKAIIKNLIASEDSKQPLSDQALTNLITQQGICIARRTVTKYREALNILASNQRGR